MENTKRQIFQHLNGETELTIDVAKSMGMTLGEIAIKHDNSGNSEIYVLSQDGNSLDVFETKSTMDKYDSYNQYLDMVVY